MPSDLIELPISSLAYIGDAYYELLVRERLLDKFPQASGKLHQESIRYVSAGAQADILAGLSDQLTDFEMRLVKRARNHQPHSLPRHASPVSYRQATAFETLIGYLYLSGDLARVNRLLQDALPDLFGG